MPNTDAERHPDSPVPDDQQFACLLWKAHRNATQGIGDGSVTWWTLQPVERMWWIETAERLTEAGVGFVAEAERQRDEARATNERLNRRVQTAEAAIHELTTGTGKGKARPVAAEMWARCQETHERHCRRAERAEAALAAEKAQHDALRARVKALVESAEQWRDFAASAYGHPGAAVVRAERVRALLDEEADQ